VVRSINPRTNENFGPEFLDTTKEEVDSIILRSKTAFSTWSSASADQRASVLHAVAAAIDSASAELVEIADLETGLGSPRLPGEVARTTFQIRQFSEALRAGKFVSPTIDDAVEGAPPSGHPQLVRTFQALGVVVVFGANNFPFAFSVLGGDTASALAAGCTVIAKAHPSHPQTSTKVFEIASKEFAAHGYQDVLTLIHGLEAGTQVLKSPDVSAGAFTGSRNGGRALFDIAVSRKNPIPFYGELGSVNPVVALQSGLGDTTAFANAYLDSLLLGNGQFCTNPSLLFVPSESDVSGVIQEQISLRSSTPFLSPGTKNLHDLNRDRLTQVLGATPAMGKLGSEIGLFTAPAVITISAEQAMEHSDAYQIECFGPTGIVVTYKDMSQLLLLLAKLDGALTGSIFSTADDVDALSVIKTLQLKVGRISWNAWPTGVAVSVGQHHGGPYPASTSSIHTSVGLHAIERFLRPVAFQGFPSELLERVQ
jgi:NADP-dependent aldehyde dehydrogenase